MRDIIRRGVNASTQLTTCICGARRDVFDSVTRAVLQTVLGVTNFGNDVVLCQFLGDLGGGFGSG